MTPTTRVATALAALALLMFVGCGGSSAPSPNSSASRQSERSAVIQSTSVVARAEAICKRKAVEARGAAGDGPSLAAIAANRARTAHELAALSGPSSLTKGYHRLASMIAEQAALLRRLARDDSMGDDEAALATERRLRRSPVPKEALIVGLANCA